MAMSETKREAWFVRAMALGHRPDECRCFGCRRWRGDELGLPAKRPRLLRQVGYCYLTEAQDHALRSIALARNMAVAELVRTALQEYIDREKIRAYAAADQTDDSPGWNLFQ